VIPKNEKLERAVLGAVIIDDRVFDMIAEYLTIESFYSTKNQQVFSAMLELKTQNETIDPVILMDKLGADYAEYIATLMDEVVTTANAGSHAKMLQQKHVMRELFRACQEGVNIASDDGKYTATEAISKIDTLILNAAKHITTSSITEIADIAEKRFSKYHSDEERGYSFEGYVSGYPDLDRLIDGFALGENTVIAARPSMGKTSLALNLALNVAKKQIPVLFFSLEQNEEGITDRLLCLDAQVNNKRYRRRTLKADEKDRLSKAYANLLKLPIKIVDGSTNTSQVRSFVAKELRKNKNLFVVSDYLTLFTDFPNLSAHERYGYIAKRMQDMAKEFRIPIVTLAQLNRQLEQRNNKRPILSDLRESGNIEEAADKVLFIYRDDYYNPNTDKQNIAEIICAKYRDGETGVIELYWKPEHYQFLSLAREQEAGY
jgi:replicative DNA helicase